MNSLLDNPLLTKLADEIEKKEKEAPGKEKKKDLPPFMKKKDEGAPEKEESSDDKPEAEPQGEAEAQAVPNGGGKPPMEEEVPPMEGAAPMQQVGLTTVIDFLQQYPTPGPEMYQMATQSGISEDELKASIHSLAVKMVNFLRGGFYADKGLDIASVNQNELGIGTKIEYEHTPDEAIAKKIALDHLADFPDYYTRLQSMLSEGRSAVGAAAVPTQDTGSEDETIEEEQQSQVPYNTPTTEAY